MVSHNQNSSTKQLVGTDDSLMYRKRYSVHSSCEKQITSRRGTGNDEVEYGADRIVTTYTKMEPIDGFGMTYSTFQLEETPDDSPMVGGSRQK